MGKWNQASSANSKAEEQFLRPRSIPWPLKHGSWPRDKEEQLVLDQRFSQWLRVYVQDSLVEFRQYIRGEGLSTEQAKRCSDVLLHHVLLSWAEELMSLDGILNLVVFGSKRSQKIINKLRRDIRLSNPPPVRERQRLARLRRQSVR